MGGHTSVCIQRGGEAEAYLSPPKNQRKKITKSLEHKKPFMSPIARNNTDTDDHMGSCEVVAKVSVFITTIFSALIGLFLIAVALYALIAGNRHAKLNEAFSTGTTCAIFVAGFLLASFSIVHTVAAWNHSNPTLKTILKVFSVLLTVALLVELTAAGLVMWSHTIIAQPANTKTSNFVGNHLLSWRNEVANATYVECCVVYTPPYSSQNTTQLAAEMCKWPQSVKSIGDNCGTSDVLACVCKDGNTQYASFFGLFLQQYLSQVAGMLTACAILHLVALVGTCILICHVAKTIVYHTDSDPDLDEAAYV